LQRNGLSARVFLNSASSEPAGRRLKAASVGAKMVYWPGELKPMEGRSLRAALHGRAIHINGATIVQSDIRATNGVIHAIDDVLLPLNPILAAVA